MAKKVTTRNPYDRTNPYTGQSIANGAVNNVYPELMLVGKVPTSIPALATNGLFGNTAKRVGTTILKGIGTINNAGGKLNDTVDALGKTVVKGVTKPIIKKLPETLRKPAMRGINDVWTTITNKTVTGIAPSLVYDNDDNNNNNKKSMRTNRLACGGKRPKAFLGAAIGAVGGIAGSIIGGVSANSQRKKAEREARRQKMYEENRSLTQAYSNAGELQDEYEKRFQKTFKTGGKQKIKPVIAEGGTAIPIDSNSSLLRGRSHKTGGIVIGSNNKQIEAETGEVVENKGNELRIYSAQPMLNGQSPAELVLQGVNKNEVFNAQENYKDMNGLNDDGSKKRNGGRLLRSGGKRTLENTKVLNQTPLKTTSLVGKTIENAFSSSVVPIYPSNNTIVKDSSKVALKRKETAFGRNAKSGTSFKNGGTIKKAQLGISLGTSDWVGAGIGAAGSLIGGLIGLNSANKMKAPESPTLYRAAKLETNYNINPQLASLERSRRDIAKGIDSDTASSVARIGRRNRLINDTTDKGNLLYGQKENVETQLLNQDALNQQQVSQQNAAVQNEYAARKTEFYNQKAVAKGNAINSIVAGVTGAAGDLITTGQQRYQDNQQISAIIGSNEKNNLKYMIDAGYVPDKSQLEAVLSSASTDEEKKYYTNVLSKLYPKTRLRKNSLVVPTTTDYGIKLNDNSNLLAQ